MDGPYENSTIEGNPKRRTRRETQNLTEEWCEKNKLPYNHYLDSDTSEQTFTTSKDQTDVGSPVKQNDSENSSLFNSDAIMQEEKLDRPGKSCLKRIFYHKGNLHHWKPSNLRGLSQISRKSENHFETNQEKDLISTSRNKETREEDKSNKLGSNKLLLPLNINVLKKQRETKTSFKVHC